MDLLKLNEYQERSYAELPSNEGWIQYGEDNMFPQYLIDLYHSSATHNALCTSIAYMIYGDGVDAEEVDAKLKLQEWGLEDELRHACLDLKIQGGFALEVIYNIDRTTISKVRHCPFENIRSGKVDDDENVNYVYYSTDWSDSKIKPEPVCLFDAKKANDHPVQILYVKPFSPGSYYYPKPDYIGSINYIELDKEIGTYHINNIKNGLAPSFTIHFKNGVPSQEERNRIRTDIERQLSGATNAGKFIVTYSDSPDRKPDFEPFPLSDADKQYEFLSTEVSDKIMVGHRVVSSAMFGVKTAGQLGNTQELDTASRLFDKQVVKPYQRIVLNAVDSILRAAGTPSALTMQKVSDDAAEANVDVSYTGIQISSAVSIVTQVRAGELTKEQGVQLLVSMLGFDQESAELMFAQVEVNDAQPSTDLAEQMNLACDYLLDLAEDVDEDEWTLIDSRKVDYDTDEAHDALWAFASVPSGTPQAGSEQDTAIVKVRYAYAPKKTGINGNQSRDFCTRMVSAGDRVWRKEDIQAASQRAVNPGWGPGGADTYDLWLYKGGGSCQHFWERRTYLRKNNQRVSVNRAKAIIREAGGEPLPVNDTRVAKRTRDQVNRGFLEPRNWTTPR